PKSASTWVAAHAPPSRNTTHQNLPLPGRGSSRRSPPMGTLADDPLIVARVLFWVFAAGVLLLPMRWSFFCFIPASHMDITTLTFASATTVGFENTVRIAVLPVLLLARTGFAPLTQFQWTVPVKLWAALVAYAAVSGLWSGFALSAAKMVVYLAAY